ncbi:DUF5818 domain-containing protein [Sphingobium algorifonticola]|uniref:Uncharacterized protein n=1 Tax=Sphingobium algorifonticola TaxID=2008318 RepID=A0A437JEG9_9SPHN|nr:DUF5818 domain-containing protein [Sphingobium algorifonticola]RVT44060.1 hypothetical protein ENE74_05020 [Sphingobium algorifonticola]
MPVNETGRLVRDAGGFLLHRDQGGIWRLILHRVPVDLVEKHVRVRGTLRAGDIVEADGVAAA